MRQSSRASYERITQQPDAVQARRDYSRSYKAQHKEDILTYKRGEKCRASERRRFQRIKSECMRAYGGEWCAYCGVTEKLCLHHPDGDGKEHRRYLRENVYGGDNWYMALRKLGFPKRPRLMVLCKKCHYGHKPDAAKPEFLPSDFLLCVG